MTHWRLFTAALIGLLSCAVDAPSAHAATATPGSTTPGSTTRPIDFNRDIRPILSNSCYACHGPDSEKRKGDPPLRLDNKDGLFGKRDDMAPVMPGKPDDSLIIMRISSDDPDVHMPPPKSIRPSLTPAQVQLFQEWIQQGAPWKDHWAYIEPTRPAVPEVPPNTLTAAHNPIDNFVAETLAEHQLHASPEADRPTLIRRLSLDLTGLPPTAEEVDAFVKDTSPNAYDKVVDRLLASPHFGERMAVWWLDLVRYADTIGFHSDNNREVWPYRDYVINAFNSDKHFDQFTREQLAGDLIPGSTDEQKVASGYNRLLETTEEGGAQPAEYIVKYETDRVRDISSVWMGATMGCCQCHDHKYDPYSQVDFYRMAAFFADIKEEPISQPQPELALPTDAQQKQEKEIDSQLAASKASLDTPTPQLEGAQQQWEASLKQAAVAWTPLTPSSAMSTEGATLTIQKDGSILASGAKPDKDKYVVALNTTVKGITAIRIEVLPDASFVAGGPGRADNGNFVLSSISLLSGPNGGGPDAIASEPVELHDASASFTQAFAGPYPPGNVLNPDKKAAPGWAILPRTGNTSEIVFQTGRDVGDGTPTQLLLLMGHSFGASHSIGHFRISVTNAARPVAAVPNDRPDAINAVLAIDSAKRTAEQSKALATYYRSISPLLDGARTQVAALGKQKTDLEASFPRTLISIATTPRVVRVLHRGNWQDTSGDAVTPAVPHFLRQIQLPAGQQRATRLDLANWLVARDNPMTSRVISNDLWRLFFGNGLAKPLDDLGSQGAPPTHPELLDWLAIEFQDSGWDVKHMVKLMVTSETYRQSSNTTPEIREIDPFNELLARQGRFRLDAEFVRDNALSISGLLIDKQGGPSVFPYQPAGYWQFLNFPKRDYPQDHGPNLYRRSLYTHWQRTFLNPTLKNFDASTREECAAQRAQSNTPQQALTLLDDPTFVESARVFAEHVIQCGGTDPTAKLNWAFETAVGRPAHDNEITVLTALLDKHLAEFKADPKGADAYNHSGETPVAKGVDPAELAAWTDVTRAILNLHETVNRL